MEILHDPNYKIIALYGFYAESEDREYAVPIRDDDGNLLPTPGTYWEIGEAIVIAPDNWA